MMLAIRMVLYALFVTLANQGIVIYEPETGVVSFNVDELTLVLAGAAGFVLTFISSRFAKVR